MEAVDSVEPLKEAACKLTDATEIGTQDTNTNFNSKNHTDASNNKLTVIEEDDASLHLVDNDIEIKEISKSDAIDNKDMALLKKTENDCKGNNKKKELGDNCDGLINEKEKSTKQAGEIENIFTNCKIRVDSNNIDDMLENNDGDDDVTGMELDEETLLKDDEDAVGKCIESNTSEKTEDQTLDKNTKNNDLKNESNCTENGNVVDDSMDIDTNTKKDNNLESREFVNAEDADKSTSNDLSADQEKEKCPKSNDNSRAEKDDNLLEEMIDSPRSKDDASSVEGSSMRDENNDERELCLDDTEDPDDGQETQDVIDVNDNFYPNNDSVDVPSEEAGDSSHVIITADHETILEKNATVDEIMKTEKEQTINKDDEMDAEKITVKEKIMITKESIKSEEDINKGKHCNDEEELKVDKTDIVIKNEIKECNEATNIENSVDDSCSKIITLQSDDRKSKEKNLLKENLSNKAVIKDGVDSCIITDKSNVLSESEKALSTMEFGKKHKSSAELNDVPPTKRVCTDHRRESVEFKNEASNDTEKHSRINDSDIAIAVEEINTNEDKTDCMNDSSQDPMKCLNNDNMRESRIENEAEKTILTDSEKLMEKNNHEPKNTELTKNTENQPACSEITATSPNGIELEKLSVTKQNDTPKTDNKAIIHLSKKVEARAISLVFMEKFKKNFDKMNRTELEELILQKLVETIVHKSDNAEMRRKIESQENTILSYRTKLSELSKQFRDLEMVHNRVVKDLEMKNQNVVTPVKITRAVGLQVCLPRKDIPGMRPMAPNSQSPNQPTTTPPPPPSTAPQQQLPPQQQSQQQYHQQQPQQQQAVQRRRSIQKYPRTISNSNSQSPQQSSPKQQQAAASQKSTQHAISAHVTQYQQQQQQQHHQQLQQQHMQLQKQLTPKQHISQSQPGQAKHIVVTKKSSINSNSPMQNTSNTTIVQKQATTSIGDNGRPRIPPVILKKMGTQSRIVAISTANTSTSSSNVIQTSTSKITQPSGTTICRSSSSSSSANNTIDLTDEEDPKRTSIIQNGTNPPALVAIPSGQAKTNKVYLMQKTQQVITGTQQRIAVHKIGNQYIQIAPKQASIQQQQQQQQPPPPPPPQQQQAAAQIHQIVQLNGQRKIQNVAIRRHPAPLPYPSNQVSNPHWKRIPPRPIIRINNIDSGIVISWTMDDMNDDHAEIVSYQIYAYQETSALPSTDTWRHVGDVKAMLLPMAVTLTQFQEGQRYHFAVRAVDEHNRCGVFSIPRTWT